MNKHVLSSTVNLTLSILIVLFGCGGKEVVVGKPAEVEDVLDLVPADVVGFVYASSFQGLNDEIKALLTELTPNDPPQEDLAMGLVDFFGAEFEMLQKLGFFDLSKNFAIFFTGVNPSVPTAAAYLKNPKTVQQLIETQSLDRRSAIHNDVRYYITGDGPMFVPLGDFIVFSESAEGCEKAIDTYRNAVPSIAKDVTYTSKDVTYTSFELDRKSGINDVIGYVKMESVMPVIREWLTDFVDLAVVGTQGMGEMTPEVGSSLEIAVKMVDGVNWVLNQADALGFTLQLNEGVLQISPVLNFKGDSEIQEYIHTAPANLTHLKYLPQQAMANGAMRFQKEDLIKLSTGMMTFFNSSDSEADEEENDEATQELIEWMAKFYEPLGEEIAFSADYSGSLMPDMLYIYDVVNENKLKRFMEDDYISYLEASNLMLRAIMPGEFSNMYADASLRPSEIYNGVEIKHYTLPNFFSFFAQLSPQMDGLEALTPNELKIYYAITDGKLIYAMSADAQPVRDTVDRIAGVTTGFDSAAGYGKITDALTLKNNFLLAISPFTAIKRTVEMAAKIEPSAGMAMMFLANLPETYSIGISSQGRAGGVEANLFISLIDFKVLIDMVTTFESSMQGMP